MSLVGLWNKHRSDTLDNNELVKYTYLSSSFVVTSPIRRTVSIPPDTRPNIEWLSERININNHKLQINSYKFYC